MPINCPARVSIVKGSTPLKFKKIWVPLNPNDLNMGIAAPLSRMDPFFTSKTIVAIKQ